MNAVIPFIVALKLPMPVSVNGAYATVRGGKKRHGTRRILTEQAKSFKERVRFCFLDQVSPAIRAGMPWKFPIRIVFNLHPPTKRRYDTSNFVKLLYDALSGLAWDDDSQICHETLVKCGVSDTGYSELFICENRPAGAGDAGGGEG